MAELGPVGALVYQALWVCADDTGMAMCDPDLLNGKMFSRWSAVGVPEITEALRHLAEQGRIRFYEGGDEVFAQIVRWTANQTIHKPSKFNYKEDYAKRGKDLQETVPTWCGGGAVSVPQSPPPIHLDTNTPSNLDTKTPKQTRSKQKSQDYSESFEQFWAAYPKVPNQSKREAYKAWTARSRQGHTAEEMIAGAKRYAIYRNGKTQYTKYAASFLGPDLHFTQPWEPEDQPLSAMGHGDDDFFKAE